MTKKPWSFMLIVLGAIVVLCRCGQSSTDVTNTTGEAINFVDSLAIPEFTISTISDSTDFHSTSLPKEGILLIKYFSPDCDHCQNEAKMYLSKKDSLQNIQTIWISGSWAELQQIEEFAEMYELAQLDPLAIGKETANYLVGYYGLTGMPFAAVYKDNQLLKEYRGSLEFDELIAINNGTFSRRQDVTEISTGE